MSLSEKYNVPQNTIKKMINDGVISCSWPKYEEVYEMYQKSMSIGGKTKTDIYYEIAEAKKIPKRTVEYIISRCKNI